MKKTLSIILAVLIIAVSLCACGAGSNSIVGSWTGTNEGISITMSFEKDGTGVMSALGGLASEKFTYKTEGSTLTITEGDDDDVDTETFEYSIDGDTLTLKADGETLTLTKDK